MSKNREKSSICELCCNAPATEEHHLIFGMQRQLADEDNLIIDLCENCHTKANRLTDRIHDNVAAERLSKMLGQMMYERKELAIKLDDPYGEILKAREKFMKRYGRSYL